VVALPEEKRIHDPVKVRLASESPRPCRDSLVSEAKPVTFDPDDGIQQLV
jgi:hypothetical protein